MLKKIDDVYNRQWEDQRVLDTPWSLGASIKYGLAAEANEDLLDISRVAMAIGHTFSIREARWVIHLRMAQRHSLLDESKYHPDLFRLANMMELLSSANRYALSERVYYILNSITESFDTSGHDVFLRMGIFELSAAKLTHSFRPSVLSKEDLKELGMAKLLFMPIGVTPAHYVIVDRSPENWLFPISDEDPFKASESAQKCIERSLQLSEEENLVYAYFLQHLSLGSKWNSLSNDEVTEIMEGLFDQVEHGFINQLNQADLINPKFLKMVGYEVPEQEEEV
jgi:hypothetical protein